MDKIALFSDIHGNFQALDAIIKTLEKQGIKDIYCLGDILSIGPSSRECIDLILNKKIPMVLGNHEIAYLFDDYQQIVEHEREYYYWMATLLNQEIMNHLKDMPLDISLLIKDYRIYLSHYAYDKQTKEHYPPNNKYREEELLELYKDINADYIFVGHEHTGQILKTSKFNYINLESSGCRDNNMTFYYLVSLDNNNQIKVKKKEIEYDRKRFEEVMNQTEFPKKQFLQKVFFGID